MVLRGLSTVVLWRAATYHQGKLCGVVHGDVQELGSVEGGEAEGQGAQGRLLLVQTHDLQPGVCVGANACICGSVGRWRRGAPTPSQ